MRVDSAHIHEDDALSLDSDLELDRRDSRTTLVLGESISGGEFEVQGQSEPPLDGDAPAVLLRSGERVRCLGWLRAPRFAVVALLVLGAGVSMRVFRCQGDDSHVHAGAARYRAVESRTRATQRIGTAPSPVRPRASGHGGLRSQSRRRPRRTQWDRTVRSTRIDGRRPALLAPQAPEGGAGSAGGTPHVDDAPLPQAEASSSVPSRRVPCVPGTLGC